MEPRSKRTKSMENHSLSELAEDIITHILSLMDTGEAVRTSVLSHQWRYSWTHIHSLNLCFPYHSYPNSNNFLTHVLQHRQHNRLSSLKIRFSGPRKLEDDECKQKLILLALDYATSHQIQEFETDLRSRFLASRNLETLDASGFGCLKTLKLKGEYYSNVFTHDIISICPNLENLSLISCGLDGKYSICHPRLVSLHLTDYRLSRADAVVVVKAPKLKFFDLYIASPVIVNLDECVSIKKVNIYMSDLTSFANDSIPELAWTQLVSELSHNQVAKLLPCVFLPCVLREGGYHFDVRPEYNGNSITYFLLRMTMMCKLLRDVRSGMVVLHVFGDDIVLKCSRDECESDLDSDSDGELDMWAEILGIGNCEYNRLKSSDGGNNLSRLLINDVLRIIRSCPVLDFLDAVRVLEKYVSASF